MMPWIKLDDQFPDHPKVVEAGPLAGWLYIAGLAYCGRYLTDGFIPRGQVRRLADVDDAMGLASKLVAVNLWEEAEDGYQVHDYLLYNPSAEQVKHERAVAAKRQQEFRDRKTGRYEGAGTVTQGAAPRNAVTNAVSNAVTNASVTPRVTPSVTPAPSYSRPTPVNEDIAKGKEEGIAEGVQGEKPRRAERATRLPRDFPLTDEMLDWAKRRVPGMDIEYAHEEFCTYWRGEGKAKLDWLQTWQNGMLKAYQRMPRGPVRATHTAHNGRAPGLVTTDPGEGIAYLKQRRGEAS